jgi:hypothetical protein
MTELIVQLPDDLMQRAKSAGLLSDQAIQELLEDAMRRQAGRRLLDLTKEIHALNIPPMSDDEIMEEVRAVRAERRAAREKAGDAGCS